MLTISNGKLSEMQRNDGAWLDTEPWGYLATGTAADTVLDPRITNAVESYQGVSTGTAWRRKGGPAL